uniref:Taste receptor type 2 n=1 Tax=Nannospalax galili TaxID=1026970 RepID=A0A0N9NNI1_NANGA|nr:taste receptor type 2 member 16 [Nannospalax galili]ALG92942.1 taste receptor type 2 member 16 [Nannospalax galili]ALG92952.1 taste receptor type 2 member 16 [Nannospalax galili]ALG92974.1 taste receptor type 2 member 16 [Nannospalax galili]
MMPIQLTIFSIIIYVLESLIIIVQSGLTVAVLFREWVHFKRLSPVEMILISLGVSHFCLQWASMLYNFCVYTRPDEIFWTLSLIWDLSNSFSFWLTSLLAAFYCIKSSSITHPVFRWLRWKISKLVPWLILGSLLISGVTVIPSAVRNNIQMEVITLDHSPRNSTLLARLKVFEQYFYKPLKMVGVAVPFLLFLVSIIVLIASLVQHWEQMQQYNSSTSSMRAQSIALRSLTIFFILFTSYFLIVLLSFIGNIFDKKTWFWFWEAVMYGVICIHSTSMLLSSPTLKKALKIQC